MRAVLNLLAFAMRNSCELATTLLKGGRDKLGFRIRLFERLRVFAYCLVFTSREALMMTLITGVPPPQTR